MQFYTDFHTNRIVYTYSNADAQNNKVVTYNPRKI